MGDVAGTPRVIRFGIFEVDLRAGELRKSGVRIKLQEQPFQILAMLLERPGEVLSREEIQKKLWSEDTFVDFEHSLATAVKKLREALGDSADNPRFIETLPKRGYRFIATVAPIYDRRPEDAARRAALQRRWRWAAVALASVVGVAVCVLTYWLSRPLPPPKVLRIVQLTNSARVVLGRGAQDGYSSLLTDGPRLFFMQEREGALVLSHVSTSGGEVQTIPTPWPKEWVGPTDISPDGTRLLMREHWGLDVERPLWVLPTLGESGRRLGDILGHDGSWSPDEREIVYATGNELFRAKADGSESRRLATLPGRAYWIRWSPDGRRLRFTLLDVQPNTDSLWELNADGTNLRPLLPGWSDPPAECCGNWTPDGKYFVFTSEREGGVNIWMLRESGGLLHRSSHQPVRLTSGPMAFVGPVPSKDGRKLFVFGLQPLRLELLKFHPKSGQLVPYLGPLAKASPRLFCYSPGGEYVAYMRHQDWTLWRSKADGTERLQLTAAPLSVLWPCWSPDGRAIAFTGAMPGKPWKIYLVSVDGGKPQQLLPDERHETDADFSPDGNRIVFGRLPDYLAEPGLPKAIHILDLRTKQVSKLPGSDGLFSPHWTPDGRYIVAMGLDHGKQMRFDFKTQKWTELVKLRLGDGILSRDGKYLYLHLFTRGSLPIYRLRISDGKLEQVVSLADIPRAGFTALGVAGMDLDDSPIFSLWDTPGDIYALEWEAP